jgi:hypothetical protein
MLGNLLVRKALRSQYKKHWVKGRHRPRKYMAKHKLGLHLSRKRSYEY